MICGRRPLQDRLLDDQTAKRLNVTLVGRERSVIADVPYRRGPEALAQNRTEST